MRPSTRVAIAGLVILGLLGGIWYWLMQGIAGGQMQTSVSPAEAMATIGQTMGAVTGVAAALIAVTFGALRMRGR